MKFCICSWWGRQRCLVTPRHWAWVIERESLNVSYWTWVVGRESLDVSYWTWVVGRELLDVSRWTWVIGVYAMNNWIILCITSVVTPTTHLDALSCGLQIVPSLRSMTSPPQPLLELPEELSYTTPHPDYDFSSEIVCCTSNKYQLSLCKWSREWVHQCVLIQNSWATFTSVIILQIYKYLLPRSRVWVL